MRFSQTHLWDKRKNEFLKQKKNLIKRKLNYCKLTVFKHFFTCENNLKIESTFFCPGMCAFMVLQSYQNLKLQRKFNSCIHYIL